MSNHTPPKSSVENLVESYLHELVQISDEDLLEGVDEKKASSFAAGILQRAKAEAGRRRLSFAKAGIKSPSEQANTSARVVISISEARAYIRQASHNPQFTLAARGLEEMSDNDILHLYQQIKDLEIIASKGSNP